MQRKMLWLRFTFFFVNTGQKLKHFSMLLLITLNMFLPVVTKIYFGDILVKYYKTLVFYKKGVLKIFAKLGKHEHRKTLVSNYLFNRVCKTQACNFIKNETPAQVLFLDFEKFLK